MNYGIIVDLCVNHTKEFFRVPRDWRDKARIRLMMEYTKSGHKQNELAGNQCCVCVAGNEILTNTLAEMSKLCTITRKLSEG